MTIPFLFNGNKVLSLALLCVWNICAYAKIIPSCPMLCNTIQGFYTSYIMQCKCLKKLKLLDLLITCLMLAIANCAPPL